MDRDIFPVVLMYKFDGLKYDGVFNRIFDG